MVERTVVFGVGLGGSMGVGVADAEQILTRAAQADAAGLDLVTLADQPFLGDRLDAYATLGMLLGRTRSITAAVTVTNPSRPVPLLARMISSLSSLSGGRVILGIGAGSNWDLITRLGVAPLSPGAAVRAMAETIILVRALSGGGDPVTFQGQFHQVTGLDPAPAPPPQIWTGSVGPQSLAVTGRHADGWVPSRGADWLNPQVRTSRRIIDQAAADAGRDPAQIRTIYNFGGTIAAPTINTPRDDTGRWVAGSVRQWVEELTGAVLQHHADGFVYRESGNTPSEVALGRWAHEIVPAVRQAITQG